MLTPAARASNAHRLLHVTFLAHLDGTHVLPCFSIRPQNACFFSVWGSTSPRPSPRVFFNVLGIDQNHVIFYCFSEAPKRLCTVLAIWAGAPSGRGSWPGSAEPPNGGQPPPRQHVSPIATLSGRSALLVQADQRQTWGGGEGGGGWVVGGGRGGLQEVKYGRVRAGVMGEVCRKCMYIYVRGRGGLGGGGG